MNTPDEIVITGAEYSKLLQNLTSNVLPYAIGAISAFFASLLKSNKRGWAKIVEALSCSSVSTGVVGLLNHYGIAEAGMAVFIGTLIGILGVDYLVLLFRKILNSKAEKLIDTHNKVSDE